MPPLKQCVRLVLTAPENQNALIMNGDTTRLFPLLFHVYWFPIATSMTQLETGKATSVIALAPDRATEYQREVTDRRNLQISRQIFMMVRKMRTVLLRFRSRASTQVTGISRIVMP